MSQEIQEKLIDWRNEFLNWKGDSLKPDAKNLQKINKGETFEKETAEILEIADMDFLKKVKMDLEVTDNREENIKTINSVFNKYFNSDFSKVRHEYKFSKNIYQGIASDLDIEKQTEDEDVKEQDIKTITREIKELMDSDKDKESVKQEVKILSDMMLEIYEDNRINPETIKKLDAIRKKEEPDEKQMRKEVSSKLSEVIPFISRPVEEEEEPVEEKKEEPVEEKKEEEPVEQPEIHYSSPDSIRYNYVGPHTQLLKRLKGIKTISSSLSLGKPADNQQIAVDYADFAGLMHDLVYSSTNNAQLRREADDIMINRLSQLKQDPSGNESLKRRRSRVVDQITTLLKGAGLFFKGTEDMGPPKKEVIDSILEKQKLANDWLISEGYKFEEGKWEPLRVEKDDDLEELIEEIEDDKPLTPPTTPTTGTQTVQTVQPVQPRTTTGTQTVQPVQPVQPGQPRTTPYEVRNIVVEQVIPNQTVTLDDHAKETEPTVEEVNDARSLEQEIEDDVYQFTKNIDFYDQRANSLYIMNQINDAMNYTPNFSFQEHNPFHTITPNVEDDYKKFKQNKKAGGSVFLKKEPLVFMGGTIHKTKFRSPEIPV
jgi:hypothetical protein